MHRTIAILATIALSLSALGPSASADDQVAPPIEDPTVDWSAPAKKTKNTGGGPQIKPMNHDIFDVYSGFRIRIKYSVRTA